MQQAMEYQAANVPVADVIQNENNNIAAPMDVDDASSTDASSKKRKAEGDPVAEAEDSKKLKIGK
jgi:hypothetical protein